MFRECRMFLLLVYPGSVMAANNALGTQFQGYTPATVGILALLIGVGGMTGMLHRLKNEYEVRGELKHPKLFVISNLFGALVAGILALLMGEGATWPGWAMAIAILISSFAGTLLVERAWMSVAAKYLPLTAEDAAPDMRTPAVPIAPVVPVAVIATKPRLGPLIGNEGKFD